MCDRLFSSTLDADWTNPTNFLTWILPDHAIKWMIAVLEELRLTISAKLMPTTTDVEVQRTLPYKKLARTI
jgi:hypothetical protein